MPQVSRILVAIDGSDTSFKAADMAIQIAEKYQAELFALYVVVSATGYDYSMFATIAPTDAVIRQILAEAREAAQKWFDEVEKKARLRNIAVKSEVIVSPTSVGSAIINYAEDKNIDILVVGTRGMTGFKKLLLGSVASSVVTYSSCPVLVVK